MATWHGDGGITPPAVTGAGWLRVAWRGGIACMILLTGVTMILLLRLPEKALMGARRPLTGWVVQAVCRLCLFVMGIGWQCTGRPLRGHGAVIANHSGWLDILVLNAAMPVFFVSKAEVRSWPGINILTAVTNTHFIARDRREAVAQAGEFAARTRAGHHLLFFPEGTSSDSRRVLPFKSTLFQAFLAPDLPQDLAIQPVTVAYQAPKGQDPRFYGWWSDMELGPHLLAVLAQKPQGRVQVMLHPPIPVAGQDRKSLAKAAETAVRAGLDRALAADQPG